MRSLAPLLFATLAACGSGQRMDEQPTATTQSAVAPKGKDAGPRGNPGIIRAMDAIPESRKGQFQRALACEVKRNAARRKAAFEVTPEYLADLDRRLKQNPKLATC